MSDLGPCPFCDLDSSRAFYSGPLVAGLWDAFPVAAGHALLVPRRHVADWFQATAAEQQELLAALAIAQDKILATHRPDGFNIGINVGAAAGQTIFHVHIHLIPRYVGDVPDPRGGVRHVVPGKGNYLRGGTASLPFLQQLPHRRALVAGEDADPLLPHLVGHLDQAVYLDMAVAFVMASGVNRLHGHLQDLLDRGGRLRLLTGDYLGVTDPAALLKLLDLQGNKELRVFEAGARSFHPKSYILYHADGSAVAFVGSSNLSEAALCSGVEWNYRAGSSGTETGFSDVVRGFENLFNAPGTRVLDAAWVAQYALRRPVTLIQPLEISPEPLPPPPEPHAIQREVLAALVETRRLGNAAGLVVLATGLGKTWLSAFDSTRPEYRRILFVAHREEILNQAMATFRRIRPLAALGRYTGDERSTDAEVLFASIQTLGRQRHLDTFARDAFDYIVVDEFHHAAAPTYRRLIDYFTPKFLLGLTATPERTDGGDLLALCQENLVYRCDLTRGIQEGLLCVFSYVGVPDEVDYTNIPWRSSHFDEEALTAAVATQSRAQNALEQYRKHGGKRTLAFCCSQRHADFMKEFFRERGVRSAAVHSGATTDPRATALDQLAAGEIDVLFAVDMFNEGLDLPQIDTVLMLRPTESVILWLQQFGRGLRCAPGKERLRVVDYIGNHRTFLIKPRTLLGVGPGDQALAAALREVQAGQRELPPGCEVTYDLAAVNILMGLLRGPGAPDIIKTYYLDFRERQGIRPTASETLHDGYHPRSLRPGYGSWLGFVNSMGDLAAQHKTAMGPAGRFLEDLEITPMEKSFKMLVLSAMLNLNRLPGKIAREELVGEVRRLAARSAVLRADFAVSLDDPAAMAAYLEKNPIQVWAGGRGTRGSAHFSYSDGQFQSTFSVPADARSAFQELAREIIDWRLAEYLQRPNVAARDADVFVAKVSHAQGQPILFLPDRSPSIPVGWTSVVANGHQYRANFVNVAVNVVTDLASEENRLPQLLHGWFGDEAGKPGTAFRVSFTREGDRWLMSPEGANQTQDARVWRPYMREKIPALFGLKFSTAIWNSGFVSVAGHLFLLVTLDKDDLLDAHQYQDQFLAPDRFQWQSQNRAARDGRHGKMIHDHQQLGLQVHLFVRRAKRVNGDSAPFVYCGDVDFLDWEHDRPITVRWHLQDPVPENLRQQLRVPS